MAAGLTDVITLHVLCISLTLSPVNPETAKTIDMIFNTINNGFCDELTSCYRPSGGAPTHAGEAFV
jgi:hypothetical protein